MHHQGHRRDGGIRSIEHTVTGPLSQSRATLIRSLHRNKGRAAAGAFLAEGERLLSELPADPVCVRWFFALPERVSWLEERFPDAEIYEAGRRDNALFATDHARGSARWWICFLSHPSRRLRHRTSRC